ncbi:MAG TPA: tetratricopeptide repeat protein [Polyangiaceae bacterium]|nr:tetratricopeptide repeat protein [Polyangiaceae bacterium]
MSRRFMKLEVCGVWAELTRQRVLRRIGTCVLLVSTRVSAGPALAGAGGEASFGEAPKATATASADKSSASASGGAKAGAAGAQTTTDAKASGAKPPAGKAPESKAPEKAATPSASDPNAAASKKQAAPIKVSHRLKPRLKHKDPPPTPEKVAALKALEAESKSYEKDSDDFRRTLSDIVKHHYEERRRRLVTHLDKEIVLEREQLAVARKEAVKRLEDFVKRYSGAYAHPEATPDAMFRLAALLEERARSDASAVLEDELQPAIALYRRIIREFPNYKEIAGVHYYLGHAYTDAGQLEEAEQAWRALVCSNHFSVQDDPNAPQKILLQPLPQDHNDRFWDEWNNKNPIPLDQLEAERKGPARAPDPSLELSFINPYEACVALPQEVKPQQEPRYVAEVWWQLGNYHFDQIDLGAGPYAFNRAAVAYERAMEFKKPPLYGVSMYKRAWTYYKQQRYREAVKWFIELLHYADQQEKETGDTGADFRNEAYTYIAGSLTQTDFDGPRPQDPFIPRADVFDEVSDPVQQEERLKIAIERVQDPKLIPQDQKWTVEVYKALAQEFTDLTQNRNAIATLELTLKNFPLDRDAPAMQDRVADMYDELARLAPEGSAVGKEAQAQALAARTKLADYVGKSAWTRKNQDDPEALDTAERLVRRGLQRAAADHTNAARSHVARAKDLSDERQQREILARAVEEYGLAAKGWAGYLEQDPNAIDAYESRFWLADARFWGLVLGIQLGDSPAQPAIDDAVRAAKEVRDSNEDDQYLQPAAYYLVVLADKVLESRYRQYEETGGAQGIARQDAVSFDGEGDDRKALKIAVPREVTAAVTARDEYNEAIDPVDDPQKNALLYAFQAADFYFVYGQFDEARSRFAEIYQQYCGANEWGYRSWEKLVSMSNFEGDADQSRKLVDSKSCAFDEETRVAEEAIRTPVRQGVAYLDARKLYDEAAGAKKDGPERESKWRAAAAAYKVALDAAPDRDEAPEAAMNGAYAYKQVGEYDKAIEMYELFIARYGNDDKLRQLKEGDPSAKPPVQANPARYENRAKYLKMAYDALANAYVLFFDYPKAAKTFEAIAANSHFKDDDRRTAAQQAMNLSASLGDEKAMGQSRDRFARLGASNRDLAEADFVAASKDLKQWDSLSPDRGANAQARQRAEASMRRYYESREKDSDATEFLVEASYWMAKMKRSAGDAQQNQWWQRCITGFIRMRSAAPLNDKGVNSALGSRQASMAAEGAFVMLDEDIKKQFDYDSGHHRYKGTPQQVLEAYSKDAGEAKGWYDQLQAVVDQYGAPEWATAAIARQGSLYDSLRSGLYNTRAPELIMFDKKTEDLLRRAEESDNVALQEKADAVRTKVETAWQEQKDRELASADQIAVDRYGAAVVLARRYNVNNAAVVRAIRRLAFLTDVVGEQKLANYAARVNDLHYTEGMFLRLRPGMVTVPDVELLTPSTADAGGAP